jgi:DNA-binding XRE family transcriptional regulator
MESIYPNLTEMMIKNAVSTKDLADVISVSEDNIIQKLKGVIPWSLVEAMNICFYFHTSDIYFLFLQLDTNT